MHTWRHIAATVLLAIFVVGGVLVPAVHAVHHADVPHEAPHMLVVQSDAESNIDCTLCEAVFHSAEIATAPAPTPMLRTHTWDAPSLSSLRPQPATHHVIRGPPHA